MFFFFLYVYLCIVFISIRAGFFFFVCFFRCELNTCCQTFYCFLDYICSARLARTAEELQTSTRPASCSPQNSRTLHCSAFLSRSSFHHLSKQSVCSVRWKPCTAFSSGSVNFDQLWLSEASQLVDFEFGVCFLFAVLVCAYRSVQKSRFFEK